MSGCARIVSGIGAQIQVKPVFSPVSVQLFASAGREMSEEKENDCPAPKRKRLSLKLKGKERFASVSSEQVEELTKAIVPKNTQRSTQWAVRCFNSWLQHRNKQSPHDKCPEDILLSDDMEALCKWLCVCVCEMRKEDGSEYTPRSIAQLIAGVQRYISLQKDRPVRLSDPNNPSFQALHRTLDNRFKQLHSEGVGTTKKQAEIVSFEEEEELWSKGVFSTSSPIALLRAVFFYNGLNFTLRGGEEHRQLKLSQLQFHTVADPERSGETIDCVEYKEHGSKNRPGGRHQLNLDNKTVVQYATSNNGERCHVYLLRLYISKLPESAFLQDIFYMKPKETTPACDSDPWYCNRPMGHNVLEKFLKDIFKEAGIDCTNKSNHSLRATSISRMYQQDVPEKLIMQRSGHLSKEGLMSYQRSTAQQEKAVCAALLPPTTSANTSKEFKTEQFSEEQGSSTSMNQPKTEGGAGFPEEVMKRLAFSNLSNCTFNFSFKQ